MRCDSPLSGAATRWGGEICPFPRVSASKITGFRSPREVRHTVRQDAPRRRRIQFPALRCEIFSDSLEPSGRRLRNSTAPRLDSVGPVDGEHHVVDPKGHHGTEKGGGGKTAAAGDSEILRQIFRRRLLEATPPRSLVRLIVEAIQHERQPLAEMAEDDFQIGKGVETPANTSRRKCAPVSMAKPQAARLISS